MFSSQFYLFGAKLWNGIAQKTEKSGKTILTDVIRTQYNLEKYLKLIDFLSYAMQVLRNPTEVLEKCTENT